MKTESRKFMDLKKWNKHQLFLRILTFPIKLILQITWGVVSSILYSFKWLKNGSQELVYGDDFSGSLVKLIEQNEIIIEEMKKN